MEGYVIPVAVVLVVAMVFAVIAYLMRQGGKVERGKKADEHLSGDEEFHARGEEFDAANPLGAPGLPESDDK